jgi:hypothetical protein
LPPKQPPKLALRATFPTISRTLADYKRFISRHFGHLDVKANCPDRTPRNQHSGHPLRFRRTWSVPQLKAFLQEHGFSPVYWGEHEDLDHGKKWIDCWSRKLS